MTLYPAIPPRLRQHFANRILPYKFSQSKYFTIAIFTIGSAAFKDEFMPTQSISRDDTRA